MARLRQLVVGSGAGGAGTGLCGSDYPPAGTDVIEATIDSLQTSLTAQDRKQMEATFTELFPAAAARADN